MNENENETEIDFALTKKEYRQNMIKCERN